MSNDILGSLMRVLVTVPNNRLGLLLDHANKLGGPEGAEWEKETKLFLRKEDTWKSPAPKPEVPLNSIIRVDRMVRPTYPDWVKDVLHPELELAGPAEYDLSTVELFLHDGQKDGKWIGGNKLYAHLKKNDMLKTCLTLRDGEEIQKNGVEAFRKFFGGKALFLWGSVVRGRDGSLRVPCLHDGGDGVVLDWNWLVNYWFVNYPAGGNINQLSHKYYNGQHVHAQSNTK